LKPVVHILTLALLAAVGAPRLALAQPEPPGTAEPQLRVAVFVVPSSDRLAPTRHTQVLLSLQRALRDNRELEVVDKDVKLADLASQIPREAISEARGLLESGEALLRKGRAAPAKVRLSTAAQLLDSGLAFVSKQELARAQFLVGVAHAILDEKKQARTWFTKLQVWRPGFTVDTELEPGKVLPLWEKAKKGVKRRPGGSIEIHSEPTGALAFVDGSLVGPTPAVAEALITGEHYVTLKLAGFQRTVRKVRVSRKVQKPVSAVLEPSKRQGELREHVDGVVVGLGAPRASSVLLRIARLLEIQHALFVTVPSEDERARFEALLYDTRTRKLLARAEARATGAEEVDAVLAKLSRTVYSGLALHASPAKKLTPVKRAKKKGKTVPFYRKWWFWTGLTAVVTVPVLWTTDLSFDLHRGPRCMPRNVCGEVVLEF